MLGYGTFSPHSSRFDLKSGARELHTSSPQFLRAASSARPLLDAARPLTEGARALLDGVMLHAPLKLQRFTA